MHVTYATRFQVLPDRLERFMTLLNGVLDAMRKESAFREAVLHRDPDSACRLLLVETWQSHDEANGEQIHRPYRRAYHEALADLLVRPREVTEWRTLRTDRRAMQHESQIESPLASRHAGETVEARA
ncbi:antibiotic biosynthesis monooxygenase [Paraburkholderia phymatum]|uniref:Antibiotic biosynthesis monooxygenase n=1 Tax=Paraburkholderia phymatum (strain DSM 17167 / CIP 108236 / LMG 21445 / STM815) TaxID=391038 RepID=B2JN47_PARP8|nr:antibiotic biosynthesis monooxygenase [Paraburkholderia phymatum]ACC72895.1 Antibiotic biosynthesis monooxygenase [Paraburkholderia phymatum STM815]